MYQAAVLLPQPPSIGFLAVAGIKRQRLGRLLPLICPEATKVTLQGTPWLIPRPWVDGWLSMMEQLPVCQDMPSGTVTLDHVLRYGPLGDGAVAQLLLDISTGALTLHARSAMHQGVVGVIIDQCEVVRRAQAAGANRMSVVQAAEHLGVKQEVAYALIRLGLLEADETRMGRRTVATTGRAPACRPASPAPRRPRPP